MKIEAMPWIVVLILIALAFLFPKTRAFRLSAIGEGKVFIQKIAHESDDLRAALRIVLAAARRAILGDDVSPVKRIVQAPPARVAGIRGWLRR